MITFDQKTILTEDKPVKILSLFQFHLSKNICGIIKKYEEKASSFFLNICGVFFNFNIMLNNWGENLHPK